MFPAMRDSGCAGTGLGNSSGVSSNSKIRSEDAIAVWMMLNFSAMSRMGSKNFCRYIKNATKTPN